MVGNELGQSKAVLLALLVVVAIGAVFVMGRDNEDQSSQEQVEEAPEEILEVTPLLTPGAIKSASWRSEDREDADAERPNLAAAEPEESLLDRLGGPDDKDERFKKSLEETVKGLDGLGVYVAPAEKKKKGQDD